MIDDDEDFEDDEDTGPIRLWPALVALGVMAVVAVVVAFVALRSNEEDDARRRAGADDADRAGGARRRRRRPARDRRGRLPPARAGDRRPPRGRRGVHRLRPGPRRRCTADIKVRCHEVVLPQAVGPRRVVPEPVAEYRDQAEALVASGPCPPMSVEA